MTDRARAVWCSVKFSEEGAATNQSSSSIHVVG